MGALYQPTSLRRLKSFPPITELRAGHSFVFTQPTRGPERPPIFSVHLGSRVRSDVRRTQLLHLPRLEKVIVLCWMLWMLSLGMRRKPQLLIMVLLTLLKITYGSSVSLI
jgi:hypothetical protein